MADQTIQQPNAQPEHAHGRLGAMIESEAKRAFSDSSGAFSGTRRHGRTGDEIRTRWPVGPEAETPSVQMGGYPPTQEMPGVWGERIQERPAGTPLQAGAGDGSGQPIMFEAMQVKMLFRLASEWRGAILNRIKDAENDREEALNDLQAIDMVRGKLRAALPEFSGDTSSD